MIQTWVRSNKFKYKLKAHFGDHSLPLATVRVRLVMWLLPPSERESNCSVLFKSSTDHATWSSVDEPKPSCFMGKSSADVMWKSNLPCLFASYSCCNCYLTGICYPIVRLDRAVPDKVDQKSKPKGKLSHADFMVFIHYRCKLGKKYWTPLCLKFEAKNIHIL